MAFNKNIQPKEDVTPVGALKEIYEAIEFAYDTDNGFLRVGVISGDSTGDAFGRLRVSEPRTLFDSKQLYDNQPLFWDDQETAGSGTGSTHSTARASSLLTVSSGTTGTRVRQTFQRFNYQPGKSQLIFMTFVMGSGETGITRRCGMYDDDNGVFLQGDSTGLAFVTRSGVSGSTVDDVDYQTDWNVDKLDGTGPSGLTLDITKAQILFIDYEWLGVGRVRYGFVIDGKNILCHEKLNANNISSVYMSTPNLPLRYEIDNDGTGGAADFETICSTVMSEAGQDKTGVLRHTDSGAISTLNSGTAYAALGIRLKSTHLGAVVDIENLSVLATTTNDVAHWELRLNPTVAGTFTYSDQPDSAVQTAVGANTNTVTGGIEIDGGYFSTALPSTIVVPNALRLGAAIDGTRDELVLIIRPVTNNISAEASITWRELN